MNVKQRISWLGFVGLVLLMAGCFQATPAAQNNQGIPHKKDIQQVASPTTEMPVLEGTAVQSATIPPSATQPDTKEETGCAAMTDVGKSVLALKTGAALQSIDVLKCFPIDWPDSSLGCPKPDEIYAQVVTPGFQILLEAAGKRYAVHTDTREHGIVCLINQDGKDLPENPILPGEYFDDSIPWIPVD
jgi:hypothetical protein